MSDQQACENTDVPLFTDSAGNEVFTTPDRHAIGINVGGLVIVKPVAAWHDLAKTDYGLLLEPAPAPMADRKRASNDEPFNYCVARPWNEDPRRLNIYTYGGDVQQHGTMQQALWLLAYVNQRRPGEEWVIYRVDFTPVAAGMPETPSS